MRTTAPPQLHPVHSSTSSPTESAPHALSSAAFALLAELTARTEGHRTAPAEVLGAVAVLTAAADPVHAARLSPRPGEPAALVTRLAMWALRQVDDAAVQRAQAVLTPARALVACA